MKLLSSEPFSAARRFYISSAVWMFVGAFTGLIAGISLVAPDLYQQYFPWLSFGRLRPMHVNTLIFGFVTASLIGSAFYYVPKVLKTTLWNEPLANLSMWLYNGVVLAGYITLALGMTQGREMTDYIWIIDIFVVADFIIFVTIVFKTIAQRQENLLYVSVWYFAAAVILTTFVYAFGNVIWDPSTGSLTGMSDAILLWFYGHNIVGLLLTPMSLAAAYYVIPRVTKSPIYSHTMSLLGFWILIIVYTHTGTHHLLQAPAPYWLKVLAIVDSISLLIPVFIVLTNLWLPFKNKWGEIHKDIGGKFIFAGTIYYALTCIQGPLQSLPSVQRLTHFTHWVVAHSHLAILGFVGSIAIGAMYHILPSMTGKKLYSEKLADFTYWLLLFGLGSMFLGLTAGGLVQGGGWLNGEAVYRILSELHLYMILRVGSGVLVVSAAIFSAYNVLMTIYGRGEEIAK